MSIFEFSNAFLVEWMVCEVREEWVYGRFVLNVDGRIIGNPNDLAVDMKGCRMWVEKFLEKKVDRFEKGLFELEKNKLYSLLVSGVLVPPNAQLERRFFQKKDETYENSLERFHISHVGMSSFDLVTLLLVQDHHGNNRLIWQAASNDIEDAYFRVGVIEASFAIFLAEFETYVTSSKN